MFQLSRSLFAGIVGSGSRVRHLTFSKTLLHNPKALKFGWSKEVVSNCLPFTSELISSRGRSLENIGVGYCPAAKPVITPEHPAGQCRTDDSWLEMVLPFSDQTKLRESMMMDDGKTVRYGKLFELLDALAADVAYRHCGGKGSPLTIVTASVDGVKNFTKIDIVDDIKMQGYITYTGTSSMEVTIDIIADREDGDDLLAETKFIMVARSKENSAQVPGLLLANDEARQRYEVGAQRARTRRARAAQSLSVSPPKADEVDLIHNLYLQSIKQQRRRHSSDLNSHDQQLFAMLLNGEQTYKGQGESGTSSTAAGTNAAGTRAVSSQISQELLNYYKDLQEENSNKWMKDTIYKSAQLMHIQDRNVHGKIFGGYIMKKAFEIAYVAAACFFAEPNPHFLFVDDIQFVRPMNVGSLAEFTSTVVYSSQGHAVVQVVVMTVDIKSGYRNKTNVLTYIFRSTVEDTQMVCAVPRSGHSTSDASGTCTAEPASSAAVAETPHRYMPQVIPTNYHQIVLYLEGKRALDQMFHQ